VASPSAAFRTLVVLATVASAALGLGCPIDLAAIDSLDDQTDEPAPSQDPTPRTVTVHFRNLAVEDAVDVQFHVSNDPVDALPDGLFVAHNAVATGIGIAGTGILEPLREDSLELPCADGLVLGTAGGAFLDNESGELRGSGAARWVEDAPIGLCGRSVLFEFVNEFGTFTTRVSIGG